MENILIRSILNNRISFCLELLEQYLFTKETLVRAKRIAIRHQREVKSHDFSPGTTLTVQESPFPPPYMLMVQKRSSSPPYILIENFSDIIKAIKAKLATFS